MTWKFGILSTVSHVRIIATEHKLVCKIMYSGRPFNSSFLISCPNNNCQAVAKIRGLYISSQQSAWGRRCQPLHVRSFIRLPYRPWRYVHVSCSIHQSLLTSKKLISQCHHWSWSCAEETKRSEILLSIFLILLTYRQSTMSILFWSREIMIWRKNWADYYQLPTCR